MKKVRSSPSFLAVCLAILAAALIISAVLVQPTQGKQIKLQLALLFLLT
jgi:hypothetical protein